jgi:peptide/nickel transport system permease protein
VRLLLQRLAGALGLLWLVLTLTFLLVRLAPGDAAELLLPPGASAAEAARLRAELGLDRPLAVQYAHWAADVLRGDLGESLAQRRPVTRLLADAFPVSLLLGGVSLLLTFVVGTLLGLVQAARRGGPVDRLLTFATTTIYAAPSFWLALTLVAVFTYGAATWNFPAWLRLPAFGMRDPASAPGAPASLLDLARHAVLPVTVLAAVGAAGIARYARSAALDVVDADFVRAARAKGVGGARLYLHHVLPNAAAPLVVLLALSLPGVLAGSVFVESIFAWPGMGRLTLNAVAQRDYPVILGATVAYAALVIGANLLADAALLLLDPRRRA